MTTKKKSQIDEELEKIASYVLENKNSLVPESKEAEKVGGPMQNILQNRYKEYEEEPTDSEFWKDIVSPDLTDATVERLKDWLEEENLSNYMEEALVDVVFGNNAVIETDLYDNIYEHVEEVETVEETDIESLFNEVDGLLSEDNDSYDLQRFFESVNQFLEDDDLDVEESLDGLFEQDLSAVFELEELDEALDIIEQEPEVIEPINSAENEEGTPLKKTTTIQDATKNSDNIPKVKDEGTIEVTPEEDTAAEITESELFDLATDLITEGDDATEDNKETEEMIDKAKEELVPSKEKETKKEENEEEAVEESLFMEAINLIAEDEDETDVLVVKEKENEENPDVVAVVKDVNPEKLKDAIQNVQEADPETDQPDNEVVKKVINAPDGQIVVEKEIDKDGNVVKVTTTKVQVKGEGPKDGSEKIEIAKKFDTPEGDLTYKKEIVKSDEMDKVAEEKVIDKTNKSTTDIGINEEDLFEEAVDLIGSEAEEDTTPPIVDGDAEKPETTIKAEVQKTPLEDLKDEAEEKKEVVNEQAAIINTLRKLSSLNENNSSIGNIKRIILGQVAPKTRNNNSSLLVD